jgi:hypothetical protein
MALLRKPGSLQPPGFDRELHLLILITCTVTSYLREPCCLQLLGLTREPCMFCLLLQALLKLLDSVLASSKFLQPSGTCFLVQNSLSAKFCARPL